MRSFALASVGVLALVACAGPVTVPRQEVAPVGSNAPRRALRWAGARGAADDDRLDVSRADFARRLATIHEGTTNAATVLEALGPPGDVRTELDPGGISACRTTEVWTYGTLGHLGLGTLGAVHVQSDGVVQYVFGGRGTPLADAALPEGDLRWLLRLLDAVGSFNGTYDPLRLIQVVNALWPLGKERALAVLSEYLRVSSHFESRGGRDGAFLVLRALFDVAPGEHHPRLLVGAPSPAEPADPTALPRFPLALVDDVPVCVVFGYELDGLAEPPAHHVEWYRAHGALRPAPLAPGADALAALRRFATSTGPASLGLPTPGLSEDRERMPPSDQTSLDRHVLAQAARLLATVTRVELPADDGTPAANARGWDALAAAAPAIAWDPRTSRYTRPDGSTLPADEPRSWPRVIWRPEVDCGVVELVLERSDPATVVVELRLSPSSLAEGRLRLEAAGHLLLFLDLGGPVAPGSSATTTTAGGQGTTMLGSSFTLAEGAEVRATLDLGGAAYQSDPLAP